MRNAVAAAVVVSCLSACSGKQGDTAGSAAGPPAVKASPSAPAAPRKPAEVLKDKVGDVRGGDDNKDVVEMSVDSDGKNLVIAATLSDDVAHLLKGHQAGKVLTVYVDSDNNPATGGEEVWSHTKGFEWEVNPQACIKYENRSEYCEGGGKDDPMKEVFASYSRRKSENGTFDLQMDSPWPHSPIQGKTLKVEVPYDKLGLHSGQVVRVVAREADGPFDKTALFPEVHLTLN